MTINRYTLICLLSLCMVLAACDSGMDESEGLPEVSDPATFEDIEGNWIPQQGEEFSYVYTRFEEDAVIDLYERTDCYRVDRETAEYEGNEFAVDRNGTITTIRFEIMEDRLVLRFIESVGPDGNGSDEAGEVLGRFVRTDTDVLNLIETERCEE